VLIAGMSTVPEVIVASHGFRDFGISVITDIGDANIDSISHDEVLEAQNAEPNVRKLIKELILKILN
jgi:purine-nucleoside phosphorylase